MTPDDLFTYLPIIMPIVVVLVVVGAAWYDYRKRRRIEAEEAAELEKQAFDRANPLPIYGNPIKHERARVGLARLEANLNDI